MATYPKGTILYGPNGLTFTSDGTQDFSSSYSTVKPSAPASASSPAPASPSPSAQPSSSSAVPSSITQASDGKYYYYQVGGTFYDASTGKAIPQSDFAAANGKIPLMGVQAPATAGIPAALPSGVSAAGSQGGMTLQSLLSSPSFQSNPKMAAWLQGNASLLPKLAANGYTAADIANEAYSWVTQNHSAFSGDMTTTPRSSQSAYAASAPINPYSPSSPEYAQWQQQNAGATGATGATGPTNSQNNTGNPAFTFDTKGQYAFVSFAADPTPNDPATGGGANNIWLYDTVGKTFHPFASASDAQSFAAANGIPVDQFSAHVTNVSSPDALPAGTGKTFLPLNYAPKQGANGAFTVPKYDVTPGADYYGQGPLDPSAVQAKTVQVAQFFKSMLDSGKISQDTWNKLADPSGTYMAQFMDAGLYGGYNLGDMYKQVKIDELSKTDPQYQGMEAIDPSMSKAQFQNTPQFKSSEQNAALSLPEAVFSAAIKSKDPSTANLLLNTPLYNVSDQLFQELSPVIDWNDPKTRADAEKIQAGYYDVVMAQATATTAEQQQAADKQWQDMRDKLWRDYGINANQNASQAWSQLQQLGSSFNKAGEGNEDMRDQAQAQAIRDKQAGNAYALTTAQTTADQAYVDYLHKNGTADEIKAYIDKVGTTKAQADGFIPSEATKEFFDPVHLKSIYPDLTDAQIQLLRSQTLDENGNVVSDAYKNLNYANYNTSKLKSQYQYGKLLEQSQADTQAAYLPFTVNQTPYGGSEDIKMQSTNGGSVTVPKDLTSAGSSSPSSSSPPSSSVPQVTGANAPQQQNTGGLTYNPSAPQGWLIDSTGNFTKDPNNSYGALKSAYDATHPTTP